MPLPPKDVEEARLTICAASAGLPHEYRKIVETVLCDKLSFRNAAEELGLSDATLYERFVRALSLLQEALKDSPVALSYTDELIDEAQKAVILGAGLTQEREETLLTPELLDWARRQFSEEEIVAGIREIRETGGLEFRDFIEELEKAAGADE
jgi:hypothetical protein